MGGQGYITNGCTVLGYIINGFAVRGYTKNGRWGVHYKWMYCWGRGHIINTVLLGEGATLKMAILLEGYITNGYTDGVGTLQSAVLLGGGGGVLV